MHKKINKIIINYNWNFSNFIKLLLIILIQLYLLYKRLIFQVKNTCLATMRFQMLINGPINYYLPAQIVYNLDSKLSMILHGTFSQSQAVLLDNMFLII